MALKKAGCVREESRSRYLTSESVQGATLPLEGIDDIHGGDGLPLGVFGVGDGIPDDVLEEHLQDAPGLLVDEARDTLHTTTASETADSGLRNTLDVVTKNFAVTLGASLSESLASFATTSHVEFYLSVEIRMMPESALTDLIYWGIS